jgi:hypothetical protein
MALSNSLLNSNMTMRAKTSSGVRQFIKDDIPQVADLYQRVFLPHHAGDRSALCASLSAYFEDLFFAGPWDDEFISSLVCVDSAGKVVGFIGVIPRRMLFKGRTLRMANSFHFMAEPANQTLAGVQLLKALLSGPQDFTFTDHGGDIGRRVWEGLGGATAFVQSFNWVRLLRPTSHAFNLASARKPELANYARVAAPICQGTDRALSRLLPRWLAKPDAALRETGLDAGTLLQCIEQCSVPYALRPVYDEETLNWLLDRAGQFDQRGELQKVALCDAQGELIGSYAYYLNRAGASKVLQLAAKKGAIEQVLDHLFLHAWQRGAAALAGRLDPRLMRELTNRHCRFDGEGGWTMVHSNDSELLQAIHCGDAWLSRLEGEWCMLYQPPLHG